MNCLRSSVFSLADLKRPQTAFSGELQHLFRSSWLNLITGAGYFDTNGKAADYIAVTILPPPFDCQYRQLRDTDVQHFNAYNYSNVNLLKNLTITTGASFDYLKGDPAEYSGWRRGPVQPEIRHYMEPVSQARFVLLLSESLKRTLITDQTLEPTQVAGFNQFFDDAICERHGAMA